MIFCLYHRFKATRMSAWLCGSLLVVLLAGCSSFKPYPNTLAKNLAASLSKDSDAGIKARVDIYSMDKQCQDHYQGTIRFDKKPGQIGIPNNKQTLLAFYFLSSHWLMGPSSINVDALIKARSGYRYEAKLTYVDSTYEVNLYEINHRSGKRREVRIVGMNACR